MTMIRMGSTISEGEEKSTRSQSGHARQEIAQENHGEDFGGSHVPYPLQRSVYTEFG
jgi:hypothetical protein